MLPVFALMNKSDFGFLLDYFSYVWLEYWSYEKYELENFFQA